MFSQPSFCLFHKFPILEYAVSSFVLVFQSERMISPSIKTKFNRRHSVSSPSSSTQTHEKRNSPLFSLFRKPESHPFPPTVSNRLSGESKQKRRLSLDVTTDNEEGGFYTPRGSPSHISPTRIEKNTNQRDKQNTSDEDINHSEFSTLDKNEPSSKSGSTSTEKSSLYTQAVVVGAGLSGLTILHLLEKHGVQPQVFESSSRVGGRILPFYDNLRDQQIISESETTRRLNPILDSSSNQASNTVSDDKNIALAPIDLGLYTISPEDVSVIELIKSLEIDVSPISDGTTLVQTAISRPIKTFKSTIVKERLLSPVGGIVAVIDKLKKDTEIKFDHKLIFLSRVGEYWRLLFQHNNSRKGFLVFTKLVFIAISPRKFAEVRTDDRSVSKAMLSLLETIPTQYIDSVQFIAYYEKGFWISNYESDLSPDLKSVDDVRIIYCPQGPVVEAHTVSLSGRGPFAIVGRVHLNHIAQLDREESNESRYRKVAILKRTIANHLSQLLGPEANFTKKVVIIDWRVAEHVSSVKDREEMRHLTKKMNQEGKAADTFDRLKQTGQLRMLSDALSVQGLFFSFSDVHPEIPGTAEAAVLFAKKAVQSASKLNFFK